MSEKKVILVTGGSGLVGNGIRIASERDPRDDETFVFLSSKDADLTCKDSTRKVIKFLRFYHFWSYQSVYCKILWFRIFFFCKNFLGAWRTPKSLVRIMLIRENFWQWAKLSPEISKNPKFNKRQQTNAVRSWPSQVYFKKSFPQFPQNTTMNFSAKYGHFGRCRLWSIIFFFVFNIKRLHKKIALIK